MIYCNHLAKLNGLPGIRACQRKMGHRSPHAYLVDEQDIEVEPWESSNPRIAARAREPLSQHSHANTGNR